MKKYKLPDNFCLEIVQSFRFTSEKKRVTQVVFDGNTQGEYQIYSKGAPEIMKVLFDPSTVPEDYDDKLVSFAEEGMRVLALGCRTVTKLSDE